MLTMMERRRKGGKLDHKENMHLSAFSLEKIPFTSSTPTKEPPPPSFVKQRRHK